MSDGIDQKPECEHAWAHKSTSVGLWVPQCYLCGEFNNADLGQQIAKVKADARWSLLEELTADAEQEASIGRQGNDIERVNAAEKIIEMLNDIRIEAEA